MPLYEKSHSWGEFVFDFAWANAYARNGLAYYPKLVSATPFTPASGPRLLVDPDFPAAREALAAALDAIAPSCSSLHVQFATAEECAWLATRGYLARIDCQFHWHNRDYADFEAFLATFTSKKRKNVRQERRRVADAGIRFEWRAGDTLDESEWRAVHALHAATFRRHGNEPYLPVAFFIEASRTPEIRPQVLMAHAGDALVAIAIFFRGAHTLYGRYWGAAGDFHSLHFEACYHQGIEYCIRERLQHFEPGTQGEHKVARGFAPTLTQSAHRIEDPRYRDAIRRYLEAEREGVLAYAAEVESHVPYRAVPDLAVEP
jgi:predicted N-acyltransferase